MHYWYAYTGESLIVGYGRAIHSIISDVKIIQPLVDKANKQYADYISSYKATAPK